MTSEGSTDGHADWKTWRILSHRLVCPSLATVLRLSSSSLRMTLLPDSTLTRIEEIASVGKIPWRRNRPSTPVFLGFPGSSGGTESTCDVGALGLIPGLGRSLEKGKAAHSSILAWKSPMDSGAWWATVHGVAKSQTWLIDWTELNWWHKFSL